LCDAFAARRVTIVGVDLVFAMSDALETTIVYSLVWFVIFPAIVTGLIVVAIVRTLGERRENQDNWKYRRR
jgi:hypothetical protein